MTPAFAVEALTKQPAADFYTLAAASIALGDLPEALQKKLPRHPSVPAVRMGRLAVAISAAGRGGGLGGPRHQFFGNVLAITIDLPSVRMKPPLARSLRMRLTISREAPMRPASSICAGFALMTS